MGQAVVSHGLLEALEKAARAEQSQAGFGRSSTLGSAGTSKSKLPVMTTLIFITKVNSDQHISRISPLSFMKCLRSIFIF